MQIPPQEAQRILSEEFNQMGYPLDRMVTTDELLVVLDRRLGGKQFDRNVAVQLLEQIEKDYYGRFPLRSFVNIYLEARSILLQKISDTATSIDNFQQQKLETLDQLREHKRDEVLNNYGIMHDSVLIVHELEINGLNGASNLDLYIKANCEGNSVQTEKRVYREGTRWNEQFKIEIKTGLDDLHLIIYLSEGRDIYSQILGGVAIPMERLRDQHRHEEWFDIFDQNGNIIQGKLHVSLHWIHSRVKYLNDLILGWDEHMGNLHEDQNDYRRDLNILNELFPTLSSGGKQFTFEGPSNEEYKSSKALGSYPSMGDNVFVNPSYAIENPSNFPRQKETLPIIAEGKGRDEKLSWETISLSGWVAFYASIVLTLFGLLSCFLKASFLDIILGVGFLLNFDIQRRYSGTAIRAKQFLYGTIWGFLLELFYLATYTTKRWTYFEDFESSDNEMIFELSIRGSALIVKAILIICHVGFFRLLRNHHSDIRQSLSSL